MNKSYLKYVQKVFYFAEISRFLDLSCQCVPIKKAMNFGIEIFIHIFDEQQSGTNMIYGIKQDVIRLGG